MIPVIDLVPLESYLLKRYFVRITQYCGFQKYFSVFLKGSVSFTLCC